MENITRTIKKTVYTCVCFDRVAKGVVEKEFTLGKHFSDSDALKIISKQNNSETLTVADVLNSRDIEQMFSISTVDFIENAEPLEKPNPALITRTIKKHSYFCVVYNRETKTCEDAAFLLDKKFSNDDALKILAKKYNNSNRTIADVLGCTAIEQLYGITVDKFMEKATPVEK